MQFHGIVLDDEGLKGFIDVVDVVRLAHDTERGATSCTSACCAKVFAFIVLDGEFAVLLPETPDAVGTE